MSWTMTKEQYDRVSEELKERSKIIDKFNSTPEIVGGCLHKACPRCSGGGVDKDGQGCIHMISCPCKNCSPQLNFSESNRRTK